jgi:uncharacterized protein (TIGR02300 family)
LLLTGDGDHGNPAGLTDGPGATIYRAVEDLNLAKPEWGTKRQCLSCGTRFYDLMKPEIACPKCGAAYDTESATKTRRARAQVDKALPEEIKKGKEIEVVAEELDAVPGEEVEEEDEALIEDTSDLGEDEDDMAEVIENVEDEEER